MAGALYDALSHEKIRAYFAVSFSKLHAISQSLHYVEHEIVSSEIARIN